LCPADICATTSGVELARSACPVDAPKNNLKVEAYTPPPEIIADVERIMQRAGIEVGGVEYIVDDRDGRLYYYDINALSNFVAAGCLVHRRRARRGHALAGTDGGRAAHLPFAGATGQAGRQH